MADIENKSPNELAEIRTTLAVDRTLMAADRTLLAWVRTALSMISFGFTIYKILQGFEHSGLTVRVANESPRQIGLFLIGMGTLASVMGLFEYWQTIKSIQKIQEVRILRVPFIMTLVMSAIGIFLFFSVITRLL